MSSERFSSQQDGFSSDVLVIVLDIVPKGSIYRNIDVMIYRHNDISKSIHRNIERLTYRIERVLSSIISWHPRVFMLTLSESLHVPNFGIVRVSISVLGIGMSVSRTRLSFRTYPTAVLRGDLMKSRHSSQIVELSFSRHTYVPGTRTAVRSIELDCRSTSNGTIW